MKNTMLTKTDAIIMPVGVTAPAWVPELTTWLGLPIAILTLLYMVFKVIDGYYQWQHRWEKRKKEKKLDNK